MSVQIVMSVKVYRGTTRVKQPLLRVPILNVHQTSKLETCQQRFNDMVNCHITILRPHTYTQQNVAQECSSEGQSEKRFVFSCVCCISALWVEALHDGRGPGMHTQIYWCTLGLQLPHAEVL